MIKFEKHDGMLFRMLEEPVPLTPDAKMPVLVRLIQDDSPMGRLNKRNYDESLNKIECATGYNKMLKMPFNNMPFAIEKFEIIGTFVEEGSEDWALHQMMKGKKVTKQHLGDCGNIYWCFYDRLRCVQEFNCGTLQITVTPEIWVKTADKCGWQIYTEPKPEPQYKVGDWVKYNIDSYLQVIEPSDKERTLCKTLSGVGVIVYPYTSSLTKVSPSEVVVHIGCMSGTVSFADADRFILRGIGNSEMANACIMFEMLDAATCELVESLLKAQNEEK